MNVINIVRRWLNKNNGIGLINHEDKCSCLLTERLFMNHGCKNYLCEVLLEKRIRGIHLLEKNGTNSTHFTQCCGTAICSDEPNCPGCGSKIIGWDADNDDERANIRLSYATSHWQK